MPTEREIVTRGYLEHLTPADLALLLGRRGRRTPEGRPGAAAAADRAEAAERLEELLGSAWLGDALFGRPLRDPLAAASPFLVFAVAVHRVAAELARAQYVVEWLGPGRSAPVFDVGALRGFLEAPRRRLFLAELLASYTHVASGSVPVATPRGIRRRRFSELDPVRLAGLLDVAGAAELPGLLRRLGDVALFLTGVFPDHVARRGFGPVETTRLLRAAGAGRAGPPAGTPGPDRTPAGAAGPDSAVGLLESLGRRWYAAASARLAGEPLGTMAVVAELPERFGEARRVLNYLAEHVLFGRREQWFGGVG